MHLKRAFTNTDDPSSGVFKRSGAATSGLKKSTMWWSRLHAAEVELVELGPGEVEAIG